MSNHSPSPNSTDDVSPLWDSVKKLYVDFEIETFRNIGGINERLGRLPAVDKTTRYYKSLMFEFSLYIDTLIGESAIGENLFSLLERIPHQNIGLPTTIKLGDLRVSLDYLLAIEEYVFCYDVLKRSDSVCEIGAGCGRTCHAFLSLGNVSQYTIVDLPEALVFAKAYLSTVLNEDDFQKVRFVSSDEFSSLKNVGLAINIDGLQDMPSQVANLYLNFISENANAFFTKNAMGKYLPNDIDLDIKNSSEFSSAMKMGLMTDVVPLFDTKSRAEAVAKYHQAFCPMGFTLEKTQRGFGQWLSYELSLFTTSV